MLPLGKRPARPGAVSLRLKKYIDYSRLPVPPASFGHDTPISAWGMLANDQWGDCVWAGAAHETMLWRQMAGSPPVVFMDAQVLSDYSSVTGFAFTDATDQGTDLQVAASYRLKTGIVDAAGVRHKIEAYIGIDAGDIQGLLASAYLFGAVGVGVVFPDSAMLQFDSKSPWNPVPGSVIEGGHYIPLVARRNGRCVFVSWGQEQDGTDAWVNQYNDENVAYLSEEVLSGGKSIEGFDLDQLKYDIAVLKGTVQPRSMVSMAQDPKLASAKLAAASSAIKAELSATFPQWEIGMIPDFENNVQKLAAAALTASDAVEANWKPGAGVGA
jgi:hypothetical protein